MSHPVINNKKGLKLNLKIQKPQNLPSDPFLVLKDASKNEDYCCELGPMPRGFVQSFEVREKIGEGAQAQVYKMIDRNSGKVVAGKVYKTTDQELIQMIKKEKEILESLSHSNVIKFEGFYEYSDCYVIITEFFQSIQLQEYILMSEFAQNSTKILNQIFDALLYLHSKNIIHQDLNVKNILIDPISHHIKIVDFGLSKQEYMQSFVFSPQGNLKYRPPNFFGGFQNRFYIDVWAFGLLVLSVMMKTICTTKKTLKLMQCHKITENINFEKEIKLVLNFMKKELMEEKNEGWEEKEKSPLVLFPYLWEQL